MLVRPRWDAQAEKAFPSSIAVTRVFLRKFLMPRWDEYKRNRYPSAEKHMAPQHRTGNWLRFEKHSTSHPLDEQKRSTMIQVGENGIAHLTTSRSVDDVLAHLLSMVEAKGITVFLVVDHSAEAAKVGLSMRPTKLVLFGSPKAGTPVMIAEPESALDLPLKILIAEELSGSTRVSYNTIAYLQARYRLPSAVLTNLAVIEQIAAAVAG